MEAQENCEQTFTYNKEKEEIIFEPISYSQAFELESKNNTQLNKTNTQDLALESLVLKFLSQNNRWYFSPLRIQKFGGKQSGFENFNKYSTKEN